MPSECKQPFHQLKIQMDGNVYGCSNGQLVGNLKFLTAEEIWNGREIKELRERLITDNYDEMCLNCPLFKNKRKLSILEYLKLNIKKNLSFIKKNLLRLWSIVSKPVEFKKLSELENLIYNDGKLIKNKSSSKLEIENEATIRDTTTVTGWVVNRNNSYKPTHIIALINGKYCNHSKIDILREDVIKLYNLKNKICSGFTLKIDKVSKDSNRTLLVFSNNKIIGKF